MSSVIEEIWIDMDFTIRWEVLLNEIKLQNQKTIKAERIACVRYKLIFRSNEN